MYYTILAESAKPEGGYEWLGRREGFLPELIKENARVTRLQGGDEREEVDIEGEEVNEEEG